MQHDFFRAPSDFDAFGPEPPPGIPWGVNFGGGDNSRALLLALHDRGLRPDWVVFADTGSEWPETYESLPIVEEWCRAHGFPFAVTRWVRKEGNFESVHENALRTSYLPSKAYGMSGCTWKWKIQPLQKWRREHGFTPSGVAIGYGAGERARLRRARERQAACDDRERVPDEVIWYPLVAFGMDRAACIARIEQEGWTSHKSACFVCPNTREHEWAALKRKHLPLYETALEIEARAKAAGNAMTASLFGNNPSERSCVCNADGQLLLLDDGQTCGPVED